MATATYTVKHISGATNTRQVLATAAEVYNPGELVFIDTGVVTETIVASESVLGWVLNETITAVATDYITVEYPAGNDCIIEVYSDGALEAGKWYDINTDGSVDSNGVTYEIWAAVATTTAAGMAKMKFVGAILQD